MLRLGHIFKGRGWARATPPRRNLTSAGRGGEMGAWKREGIALTKKANPNLTNLFKYGSLALSIFGIAVYINNKGKEAPPLILRVAGEGITPAQDVPQSDEEVLQDGETRDVSHHLAHVAGDMDGQGASQDAVHIAVDVDNLVHVDADVNLKPVGDNGIVVEEIIETKNEEGTQRVVVVENIQPNQTENLGGNENEGDSQHQEDTHSVLQNDSLQDQTHQTQHQENSSFQVKFNQEVSQEDDGSPSVPEVIEVQIQDKVIPLEQGIEHQDTTTQPTNAELVVEEVPTNQGDQIGQEAPIDQEVPIEQEVPIDQEPPIDQEKLKRRTQLENWMNSQLFMIKLLEEELKEVEEELQQESQFGEVWPQFFEELAVTSVKQVVEEIEQKKKILIEESDQYGVELEELLDFDGITGNIENRLTKSQISYIENLKEEYIQKMDKLREQFNSHLETQNANAEKLWDEMRNYRASYSDDTQKLQQGAERIEKQVSDHAKHMEKVLELVKVASLFSQLRDKINKGESFVEDIEKMKKTNPGPQILSLLNEIPQAAAVNGTRSIEQMNQQLYEIQNSQLEILTDKEGFLPVLKAYLKSLLVPVPEGLVPGMDPISVLSRAHYHLEMGSQELAVNELQNLTGPPAKIISPWLAQAQTNKEVSIILQKLHQQIVQGLKDNK